MVYRIIAYLVSAFVACLTVLYLRQRSLQQQVEQLRACVARLADSRGHPEYRTDYIDEILRNELTLRKQSGQDAEAVKRLREQTGWSLLEAKRYIDRL